MKSTEVTSATETVIVAEQSPNAASEKATAKRVVRPKKDAPKANKGGKRTKPNTDMARNQAKLAAKKGAQAAATNKTRTPRAESKGAKVVEMISRSKGATLTEIMAATNWRGHSVRGFISTVARKKNIAIESAKNDAGDRVYRIAK